MRDIDSDTVRVHAVTNVKERGVNGGITVLVTLGLILKREL